MGEYKIRDIERLTGIRAHTIRIWEKRYGILRPTRSETKIRKYCDEDLRYILNVSILNQNGFKISKIADMDMDTVCSLASDKLSENVCTTAFENLLLGLIDMDERHFSKSLDIIIKERGMEDVFPNCIIPFLSRIGVMWQAGSIHPGQEHFISQILRQKLFTAINALPIPKKSQPNVLLFLPEGEWHELGLLFQHFYLRKHKINGCYLGQSTPVNGLVDTIKKMQPKAIFTGFIGAIEEKQFNIRLNEILELPTGCPVFLSGQQALRYRENLSLRIEFLEEQADLERFKDSILESSL
jgi:DNA-binding transcriptional MerR regulator